MALPLSMHTAAPRQTSRYLTPEWCMNQGKTGVPLPNFPAGHNLVSIFRACLTDWALIHEHTQNGWRWAKRRPSLQCFSPVVRMLIPGMWEPPVLVPPSLMGGGKRVLNWDLPPLSAQTTGLKVMWVVFLRPPNILVKQCRSPQERDCTWESQAKWGTSLQPRHQHPSHWQGWGLAPPPL